VARGATINRRSLAGNVVENGFASGILRANHLEHFRHLFNRMGPRMGLRSLFFTTILLAGVVARGDTITMKDGTVLQGVAIQQGDNYWIKTTDGGTRTVPSATVASIGKGGPAAAAAPTASAATGGVEFTATQRKVESVLSAYAAVKLWQKFMDANPTDPSIPAAQAELARWKRLAADHTERINGKWVSGTERKAIVEKAYQLSMEGWELMKRDQTLAGVKKVEESARLYPNSFLINFVAGYLMVLSDKNTEALRYMEAALRINPKSPETLNNMGVAHMRMRQYVDGINCLYKAAEMGDSAPLCQNLVTGIASLPPVARNAPQIKPALDAAKLLASKYSISGPSSMLTIVGLPQNVESPGEGESGPAMYSGTGFFINEQGLILTNRHVVKGAKKVMVVVSGAAEVPGEIVAIDKEQDLALVRIKPSGKTPFVHFSKSDNPGDGAECTVLGFPMIDRIGASIKITRGIVSSGASKEPGADVLTDAKVNPGNSGGPMVDRYGNVMGVVTMKSANSRFEDSYGMAISAGRVRQFLVKNSVNVDAGEVRGASLNAEEIAAQIKPATVCIICTE
jgi:S1-C subfamily serine protease